jgi:hypothetical protein
MTYQYFYAAETWYFQHIAWSFIPRSHVKDFFQSPSFFYIKKQGFIFSFSRVLCRLQGITCVCLKALSLFPERLREFLFSVFLNSLAELEAFPLRLCRHFFLQHVQSYVKRDENAESLSTHGGQHSRWENWEKNHRPNVRAVSLDKESCANKSAFSRRNLREEYRRENQSLFSFFTIVGTCQKIFLKNEPKKHCAC